METRERVVSVDVLRTFAILCVILGHAVIRTANGLLNGVAGLHYSVPFKVFVYFCNAFTNTGVPIFVMLTGFLMLPRTFDKDYVHKYIKNNLIPLIVSFEAFNLCSFLASLLTKNHYTLKDYVLSSLFLRQGLDYLWFMDMMIGLYIGLPLLSYALSAIRHYHVTGYALTVLSIAVLFISVLPAVNQILFALGVKQQFHGSLYLDLIGTGIWTIYMVCGYLIHEKLIKPKLLVSIIAVISSLIVYALLIHGSNIHGAWLQTQYQSIFILIPAASIFIIVVHYEQALHRLKHLPKICQKIASSAFGMYAIHVFALRFIDATHILDILTGSASIRILLSFVFATILSFIAVTLLAFIKPVRRWILLMR